MKYFLIFSIFCFLCSCSSRHIPISKEEKITAKIRERVIQKLRKETGLVPFGFGCGGGKNEIKFLELTFQYYQPLDIEEGRKLLIQATEEFLHEINSNEKVRPYLQNYPFEPKNVSILILLQKPDGREVDQGELTLIGAKEGSVEYEIYEAPHRLTTVHKETYEEALQALQNQESVQQTS